MAESNPKPKLDPFVTFIGNGSPESDGSVGLRPRPKAPQQTKNFPTKKKPHLP